MLFAVLEHLSIYGSIFFQVLSSVVSLMIWSANFLVRNRSLLTVAIIFILIVQSLPLPAVWQTPRHVK